MKTAKVFLSAFLAILFVLQTAPLQGFAVGEPESELSSEIVHDFKPTEPIEIVELRDAYTKHFRTPDGEYYAEVHAQPVHYSVDGEWTDYDLKLSASDIADGYTVQGSDTPVFLPAKFSDGEKITVTHGRRSVGFRVSSANAGFNTKSSARQDSATGAVRYGSILPNADITYTVLTNGVKENIIVKQKQAAYRYLFDMDLGGMLPVPQDGGSIWLMPSENAIKPAFILDAPLMFDATGNLSRDVSITIRGNRLTVEADDAWVNDENRVFPVTIDPYCYVPSNSSYIHTGYVTNLHPSTNYVGKISTGRNGLYADRTYLTFDFPDVPDGCDFFKATLVLYQNSGMNVGGATNYIELYDLSDYNEWSYNTVTWNNQPVPLAFGSYAGTPYISRCQLSTDANTVYTFNITSLAEDYYDEIENNGYLLAMHNEVSGAFAWMGEVGGNMGTPPELRVYYVRPCTGCGDKCVFDTSNGESCPCPCPFWETCNCPQCGHYCECGKLNCAYGEGCGCSCDSAAQCTCVACKGITTTVKDNEGNITSYSVTDGTKTMTETYTYNAQNSMTGMVDSNGNSVYYTYDNSGEKLTSITMDDATVNYTINGDDLLTNVSQSVTGLTNGSTIANSYTYDTDKNVTSIAHNGFAYNFTYDANGNNTEVDVGSEPLAEYTYDASGLLRMIEYGNMARAIYYYNTDGQVTEIYYSDGGAATKAFAFTYNADGVLLTIADYLAGTRTEFGSAVSNGYAVYRLGTNTILNMVEFDDDDSYSSYTASGAWGDVSVEYQDSAFDFETGETTYAQTMYTCDCTMVSEMVYDYFGRKSRTVTESTPNDSTLDSVTVTESIGYNDTATTAGTLPTTYASSITDGTTTTERAFRYTYDSKGNISAVYNTTTLPESPAARYTYDEANQLVREDNAQTNKTVTYAYDKGGNIVTKTEYAYTLGTPGTATDTIAYTYDTDWKDELLSYDGMEIDYDEIGNPYGYTHGRDFMWCGRELWEAYLENGDQLQMRYNENGLRSYKRLREDATHESEYFYFWSDDNRLLGYTYDPDMTGTSAFSVTVLYDTENAPIGFSVDEETYYYVKNIQGDVLCVTDVSGAPVAYYTYDAWGNFTFTPDVNATNQQALYVYNFNPATYRGYYFDNELALYYLQSRYYDPETGRFINADLYCDTRIGVIGTNTFSYCNNNAVCYIDPDGFYTITNSFSIGYKKEPDLLSDIQDQYHYNSAFTKNRLVIRAVRTMWFYSGIATYVVESRYPNGILFYRHFRTGKGRPLYYDYQMVMDADYKVSEIVGTAFLDLLYYVEYHFNQGDLQNNDYVCLNGFLTVTPGTLDWWYALGEHRVWLRGKVYYNTNTNMMNLSLYIVAKDRYNFDRGGTGMIGYLSAWNGIFVEVGYARFFDSIGIINTVFEWRKGTYV